MAQVYYDRMFDLSTQYSLVEEYISRIAEFESQGDYQRVQLYSGLIDAYIQAGKARQMEGLERLMSNM
jgi:hypothetical protein